MRSRARGNDHTLYIPAGRLHVDHTWFRNKICQVIVSKHETLDARSVSQSRVAGEPSPLSVFFMAFGSLCLRTY